MEEKKFESRLDEILFTFDEQLENMSVTCDSISRKANRLLEETISADGNDCIKASEPEYMGVIPDLDKMLRRFAALNDYLRHSDDKLRKIIGS